MSDIVSFDAYAPAEIARKVEAVGVTKASLPVVPMFMLGVVAGGFIGLGGLYATLVLSDASLSFALSRVLAGVVFSLGLVLVVVAGAELFTGNNLLWRAEWCLREAVEHYSPAMSSSWASSYRSLNRVRDASQDLGGFHIYGYELSLSYMRDLT